MLLNAAIWTLIVVSRSQGVTPGEGGPGLFDGTDYGALLKQARRAIDIGRPDQAVWAYRKALEKMEADRISAGLRCPIRIALATAHLETGQLRRAEESLLEADRCQPMMEGNFAAAALANAWGGLHVTQGRYREARLDFAGGLGRIPKDRGPLSSTLLDNLAAAEIRLDLYPDALAHQNEALRRWQALMPGHPLKLIKAYVGVAAAQYYSSDLDAAHSSMLQAIASTRRFFGEGSPVMADVLESNAVILRRLGLKREARSAENQAHRIRPAKIGGQSAYTVDVNTLLSKH